KAGDGSMSDEKEKDTAAQPDQVKVEDDGKATITEEAAERAAERQEATPSVQTTSEPSDSPAAEQAEQASGTADAAGTAAKAEETEARPQQEEAPAPAGESGTAADADAEKEA